MPRLLTITSHKIYSNTNGQKFYVDLNDYILDDYNNKLYKCIFESGFTKYSPTVNIKNGEIKDYYSPSILGIGIIGNVKNARSHPLYNKWKGMICRCYDTQIHTRLPKYSNCTVSERWKTFEYFIEDFSQLKGYQDYINLSELFKFDLDKDLIIYGNTIYSIDTCCIVPCKLNYLFLNHKYYKNRDIIGIRKAKKKYQSCGMFFDNVTEFHPKSFNTIQEASDHYFKHKKMYIDLLFETEFKNISYEIKTIIYDYYNMELKHQNSVINDHIA